MSLDLKFICFNYKVVNREVKVVVMWCELCWDRVCVGVVGV